MSPASSAKGVEMRPLAAITRPTKKMFLVFKEFIVAAAMPACPIVGVRERQAVDEPGQQRQGSRNEATGSYNQADEEDVLGVQRIYCRRSDACLSNRAWIEG